MTKYLYKSPLDESRQTGESSGLQSQLAEAGLLKGGGSALDQVSSNAPDLPLEGQFKPPQWHAQLHAAELEELANSGLEALPLFRDDGRYSEAGYYEIESASTEPLQANARAVYEWSLELKEKGTRQRHYRTIETNVRDSIANPFAGGGPALIGVPAAARKTQWYDAQSGDRDIATPAETNASEYGDVSLYDLSDGDAAVGGDVRLVYEIDYGDEAPSDCKIYDTLGQSDKFLSNGEGRVRLWQAVFSDAHDIDHEIVFDNGLLRLRLDEAAGTLEAGVWDPSATTSTLSFDTESNEGAWVDAGLSQPSTIELFDVDISEIGMVRDEAQLTFDVSGSLYALDVSLQQGHDTALFEIPSTESDAIPSDLETWLEPIASGAEADAQPTKALTRKRDVRQ